MSEVDALYARFELMDRSRSFGAEHHGLASVLYDARTAEQRMWSRPDSVNDLADYHGAVARSKRLLECLEAGDRRELCYVQLDSAFAGAEAKAKILAPSMHRYQYVEELLEWYQHVLGIVDAEMFARSSERRLGTVFTESRLVYALIGLYGVGDFNKLTSDPTLWEDQVLEMARVSLTRICATYSDELGRRAEIGCTK